MTIMMGIIALDSAWKDESFEPKYKNLATLFPEKKCLFLKLVFTVFYCTRFYLMQSLIVYIWFEYSTTSN